MNSVLRLKPAVAAFDCDGTLWAGDAGEGFFSWELDHGLVTPDVADWARQRYADYRAGNVPETEMCGEMVFMHEGLSENLVERAAIQYFDENFLGKIFPEMRNLISRLHEQGCDVWAVSSTNEWVIRAAMRYFGIPRERILAAAVEVNDGIITDHLVRVPSGDGKPEALRAVLQAPVDVAFGNSKWDIQMLAMAGHAFAVNPNPDLEEVARKFRWRIYFPDIAES
ncbi:MAG TPA: haloacid dehalogenase-like hydrolase [Terriglobales bacterium]|nr:haloacid dehalogenase-like hydrolase [Terriglobales bacterium]